MPTCIRSSSSTLAGSLAIMWCAILRTSGTCWRSSASRWSWPLAVYIGSVVPDTMRRRWREEEVQLAGLGVEGRWGRGAHRCADQLLRIGTLPGFGNALALGQDAPQHPAADQRIGQPGWPCRFGQLVERIPLAAGVEHQQAVERGQIAQRGQFAFAGVAGGQTGGVDQHQLL